MTPGTLSLSGSSGVLEWQVFLPAAVSFSSLAYSAHRPGRCHWARLSPHGEGCWGHSIRHQSLCPPHSGWFLQTHLAESLGIPRAPSSTHSPQERGPAGASVYLRISVGPNEASPAKDPCSLNAGCWRIRDLKAVASRSVKLAFPFLSACENAPPPLCSPLTTNTAQFTPLLNTVVMLSANSNIFRS